MTREEIEQLNATRKELIALSTRLIDIRSRRVGRTLTASEQAAIDIIGKLRDIGFVPKSSWMAFALSNDTGEDDNQKIRQRTVVVEWVDGGYGNLRLIIQLEKEYHGSGRFQSYSWYPIHISLTPMGSHMAPLIFEGRDTIEYHLRHLLK